MEYEENDISVQKVVDTSLDFINRKITADELNYVYVVYAHKSREERVAEEEILIDGFDQLLEFTRATLIYYYFLTFLINATQSVKLYTRFLNEVLNDGRLTKENRFFIYKYLSRLLFLRIIHSNEETDFLMNQLYISVYDEYEKSIAFPYTFIPKEERNQKLIFVMTGQVLGMQHGPTKTLLDRCYILEKYMNKKVFIINTAEMTHKCGRIALFDSKYAKYIEEYNDKNEISYMDWVFPFFQCQSNMPEENVIREILKVIASEKPYCIVTIGGESITGDLCSKIIPTITISTVPSSRTQTLGQFQAVGCRIKDSDRDWAKINNLSQDHFIESVFTSSFKEQEHTYLREELGMRDGVFSVVVVGGRLDTEIDESFLKLLGKLMHQHIYVVLVGGFEQFEKLADADESIREYGINLGVQDDVLAVLECCDVYINPIRTGGGTSVAEALYKGLPVVTTPYGDGGLGAGEDFWVKDYTEMYEQIIKYVNDKKFYTKMSDIARQRAAILTDGKGQFIKIMKTAFDREGF